MKNKTCKICFNKKVIFVGEREGVNLVQCDTCKTILQNPIPSENDLKNFYNSIYKKEGISYSTEKAFDSFDPKQEAGRLKAIKKYKKGGRLLDVGASSGFFLKSLKHDKKWKLDGVEYSLAAVRKAKENGVLVIHGDISSPLVKRNFYDVITMHSVLEHVPNPHEYVAQVHDRLNEHGIFVVSVPNIASVEYGIYKLLNKNFPGFIREHIFYYTPYSFRLLLEMNNFTVLSITSRHYSTLHLPPMRPLMGWLTFLPKLILEYTDVGGKFKKGNILYAYAKKNNK